MLLCIFLKNISNKIESKKEEKYNNNLFIFEKFISYNKADKNIEKINIK